MRAWVLRRQAKIEERPLSMEEMAAPEPGEGEIRIKVLVCGICRTDIHIAEGDLARRKSPVTLGHEVVGVVNELGEKADRFKVGDMVGAYWLHSSCGRCKYCVKGQENYCPYFKATGWDEDGGFAEYLVIPEKYALSLGHVLLEPREMAPLMCPGIAGYAAFKLTGAGEGDKLGLYGFGPTAYFVLKVAQTLGIETYVSTRSLKNIELAKKEGATWAANAAKEGMPCGLDAGIIFPPAGNLVEPALAQIEKGGTLVLAPVSSSPITIEKYSDNLWGRSINTLYNLNRDDAREFFSMVEKLDLDIPTAEVPFEELQDAMIRVKQGKAEQPNVVVRVAEE